VDASVVTRPVRGSAVHRILDYGDNARNNTDDAHQPKASPRQNVDYGDNARNNTDDAHQPKASPRQNVDYGDNARNNTDDAHQPKASPGQNLDYGDNARNNTDDNGEHRVVPRLPPGADPNGPHPGYTEGASKSPPTSAPSLAATQMPTSQAGLNDDAYHNAPHDKISMVTVTYSVFDHSKLVNLTVPPGSAGVIELLTSFSDNACTGVRSHWWDFFFRMAGTYRDTLRIIDPHAEVFTLATESMAMPRWVCLISYYLIFFCS
jgi:hypothetical protein